MLSHEERREAALGGCRVPEGSCGCRVCSKADRGSPEALPLFSGLTLAFARRPSFPSRRLLPLWKEEVREAGWGAAEGRGTGVGRISTLFLALCVVTSRLVRMITL